jgi:hypothetical protein
LQKIEFANVTVKDPKDIQKLADAIPALMKDIAADGRCVPVMKIDTEKELVLVQNGKSLVTYKVDGGSSHGSILESGSGIRSIEKFLDEFDERKHLVVLYDDPKIARSLEFRYIKTGLERKGQQCIYAFAADDVETPESITRQMSQYGIDVSRYLIDGSLKFVQIVDPSKDPEGFLAGAMKNVEKVAAEVTRPPVRVVAHQKYQFNTDEEIQGEIDAEKNVESGFENFPGSLLCNHYVGGSLKEKRDEWTKKMTETHDNVMVVTASGAS